MATVHLAAPLMMPAYFAGASAAVPWRQLDVPTIHETQSDELLIEWKAKTVDLSSKVITFAGGVKVTYGPTVVTADEVTIDYNSKEGVATGKVQVVDPEGSFTCERLLFNYERRTGQASNVILNLQRLQLSIRQVVISPGEWRLIGTQAIPDTDAVVDLKVDSPDVVIRPGRKGTVKRPSLTLGRRKLMTLPDIGFSLDRRVTGFRLPTVSFSSQGKPGVTWSNSVLLSERLSLSASAGSRPRELPTYGLSLTWSGLSADQATGLQAPRSEFSEIAGESYLDSVMRSSPDEEDAYLRQLRRSASLSSSWTLSTSDRRVNAVDASKLVELSAEVGGPLRSGGGMVTARLQRIKPGRHGQFINRATITGAANVSSFHIFRGLDARLRLDGAAFLGGGASYSWVRAQAGLICRPAPGLRLALGYGLGKEFGTSLFAFDRPYTDLGMSFRADYELGPVRLSGLWKYDVRNRHVYDREYAISLIAGLFEPFVAWRQFPKDYRIGVRLRLDSVLGKLQKRTVRREPGIKQTAPGAISRQKTIEGGTLLERHPL